MVAVEQFAVGRMYISGNYVRAKSLSVWVDLRATVRMQQIYYFRLFTLNLWSPQCMGMFWGLDWE